MSARKVTTAGYRCRMCQNSDSETGASWSKESGMLIPNLHASSVDEWLVQGCEVNGLSAAFKALCGHPYSGKQPHSLYHTPFSQSHGATHESCVAIIHVCTLPPSVHDEQFVYTGMLATIFLV